jgi:hypothetical protein
MLEISFLDSILRIDRRPYSGIRSEPMEGRG